MSTAPRPPRPPSEPMRARARPAALALALGLFGAAAALADASFVVLEGHGGPVKGVAVSPGGGNALTASFDYSAGYWDLGTGKLVHWLEGHEAAVNAVAFLPGGDRAVSGGDDFDVILWDLETGEPLRRMEGHRGKVFALTVSPDGNLVASSGWDGRVGLWPLPEGDARWLEGHAANVNDAKFTADGTKIFTASYDGTIRRWDVATGAMEAALVEHGFGVNHLVLNEAAGWLAYGAVDGAVRALDLATGEEIADLTAERRPILALAASPDGRFLAVGDGQGYIMVIDTADWTIVRDFHAAIEGPIWALDWTRDGKRLVAGGIADEAAVWPLSGGTDALFAERREFHTPPSEMSNGERQFVRKCSICHTLKPDGERRAGPTLYGLFGRKAGTVEGYSYSKALEGADIVWNADTIGKLFELGPHRFTPGSKMPLQQINDLADRRDLISYLKENTGPANGATGETQ